MITTVQSSAISIAADRIQAGSLGINYIFLYFQEFLRFLCSSPVDQVKLLIHSPFMVKSNNTLAIMILQKMPLECNRFGRTINSVSFLSNSPQANTNTTSNQF